MKFTTATAIRAPAGLPAVRGYPTVLPLSALRKSVST